MPASARAALSLLTVLPAGSGAPSGGATIVWFVPVGALLGALLVAIDTALSRALPAVVVVPLDLVALALLTGSLHLDGLADSADGLFGGGRAEHRLEIMREPGIGAFAVVAVALVLLVDVTALTANPARGQTLWLAAVCSRWVMSIAVWAFPSARTDGLGVSYRAGLRARHAAAATAIAAALTVPFGLAGAAALAVAAALGALVAARALAALGGLTGDVYGAVCEVAFAGVLVTGVALS